MFTSKQPHLFKVEKKTSESNTFISAGMQKSAETLSGNAALKYSTTGNPFVDQFGKLGSYKQPRQFDAIAADCETLWAKSHLLTITFILYIRMITRVTSLLTGKKTAVSQKGAELRHEGIMRMIWLHLKQPVSFWKNIGLFVAVGSWKDIIQMLSYDLQYNGWSGRVLDWAKFGSLILTALESTNTSELVKKYLPTIKANSKCTTLEAQADNLIGKWICSLLYGTKGEESGTTYKKYRKLKASGTAHQWQQLISQRTFDRIDFSKIHGRALHLLVKGKFLANQGLKEKYEAWVGEAKKVKFTGFVHELFEGIPYTLISLEKHRQDTINKQFATLVAKAGEKQVTPLIVVRDTSGSMGSTATGTRMSCYNVAKALALFFSEFLYGHFADAWIEFNSDAQMHKWKGTTPLEKWYNDKSGYVGSTNFLSVVQLLCDIRETGIPEEDFPQGILCISDSEFNPTELNVTNVNAARKMLTDAGFSSKYVSNFVIVLWNLQSNYYGRGTGEKFETYGDVENVFYFSGYSAATVGFLTEKIKTAWELFETAMLQEVLQMVEE